MRLLDCGRAINLYSYMVDEMNIRNLADLDRSCLGADVKEQIRRAFRENGNRDSSPTANRKSSVKLAKELPFQVHEDKRFTSPVRVAFHSVRRGNPDRDNLQGKAVLDAIVNCGVLPDDGPEWIPERPVHTVEHGQEEKTIITIEAL